MNQYVKLVNFEISRFFKIYVTLIIITILSQTIGVILEANSYVKNAKQMMKSESLSLEQYTEYYSSFTIRDFMYSDLVIYPALLCIAVLGIYVFFIWYKEWLGKSTFIYRLLMLPTERRNVYFAKLTAFLMFVLCLVGIELGLFEIYKLIAKSIVPVELYSEINRTTYFLSDLYMILYPNTLIGFVKAYAIGIAIVAAIFTAILFERSIGLKGIIIGVLYILLSLFVILLPSIIQVATSNYFYKNEYNFMIIVSTLITLLGAIYTSSYLLKNKINV